MYLDVSFGTFLPRCLGFLVKKGMDIQELAIMYQQRSCGYETGRDGVGGSCLNVMVFSFSGLKWEQFGGGGGLIL